MSVLVSGEGQRDRDVLLDFLRSAQAQIAQLQTSLAMAESLLARMDDSSPQRDVASEDDENSSRASAFRKLVEETRAKSIGAFWAQMAERGYVLYEDYLASQTYYSRQGLFTALGRSIVEVGGYTADRYSRHGIYEPANGDAPADRLAVIPEVWELLQNG